TSPLYDALAGAAAMLPVGEPGFRLAVLAALLSALTLVGIVGSVRALVRREVAGSLVAAALLLTAAPFREAAASATPAMLAACGATWAIGFASRYARSKDRRDVVSALVGCVFIVGSAPWLGVAFVVIVTAWLWRHGAKTDMLALSIGAIGVFVIILWLDALGS